jgi:hypothetical protein
MAAVCCPLLCAAAEFEQQPKRIVLLKVDGLNADLLYSNMRQQDPATGESRLPWFEHIFGQNGTVFENFYTRGISLSTPSWSMLDTGRHTIIRGNVEWDRWTGEVYDYMNFFPFYLSYARNRQIDMPAVRTLDRAGIPLIIDSFPYEDRFQSFQLFQRGARWSTLKSALERRFSSRVLIPMLEGEGTPSMDETLGQQTEYELIHKLQLPQILYLDYFTGEIDHTAHATNEPAALFARLRDLDALAGRIWTGIQKSPLADQTVFVVVSDHGMNNVPGVHSQGFSLPDFFNSPEGGAQHVLLNRNELSDYKMRGLNPLVKRAFAQSTASYYLPGQADAYPTAWLDVDGNERASVCLRNNDWNKIHILLLQLARGDLKPDIRAAAAAYLANLIESRRQKWSREMAELDQELGALQAAIEGRKRLLASEPTKFKREDVETGRDKMVRREAEELSDWQREYQQYTIFSNHVRAIAGFHPDATRPFNGKVSDYIPEMSLGDPNSLYDLQSYVVGPGASGLVLDSAGRLDEQRSFRRVNYLSVLAAQRVRNNPQPALSSKPIDFSALRLPATANGKQRYWLNASDDDQLLITADASGNIALQPVSHLVQAADGELRFESERWRAAVPLHLFEDPQLQLPAGSDRAQWLSLPHSEREWMDATHLCKYSNGVIGITELFSPVTDNVPGPPGITPLLLRSERRRRELVQPDFEVFAADHWNFNVRNFNPGGNHGAFFRISTHSVWMMAGSGIPVEDITEPYDSLNFASTVLQCAGRPAPMPDRVVPLTAPTAP